MKLTRCGGSVVAVPPAPAVYDAVAVTYETFVARGNIPHVAAFPALISLLGAPVGQRILDLGCGTGAFTEHLARGDAGQVTGIDVSGALIEQARIGRLRQQSWGVSWAERVDYRIDDARRLSSIHDASMQAVTSSMSLADIDDLAAVYHAVARVLMPGGRFVVCLNHPCAPASQPDGTVERLPLPYHESGWWRSSNPESMRGQVGANHRPLSAYMNLAADAGLLWEPPMLEIAAPPEALVRTPGYAGWPFLLALRWRRLPPGWSSWLPPKEVSI